MILRVRVDLGEKHWDGGAAINLDDAFVEHFKPLRTVDDPLALPFSDSVMVNSHRAERVLRLRKEAAAEIAQALTDHLIKVMSSKDTHNGYRVVDDETNI